MKIIALFLVLIFFIHEFEVGETNCLDKKIRKLKLFSTSRRGRKEFDANAIIIQYFEMNVINTVLFTQINEPSRIENISITDTSASKIDDPAFFRFTELKTLILTNNFLEKITSQSFASLINVERINLSSNLIATIDKTAFKNLEKLFFLYLADNCIKIMDSLYFSSSDFHKIDLSNNFLTVFPKLENVILIRELKLANNEIEILSFQDYYSNVHELDIRSNKINCIITNGNPLVRSMHILKLSNNLIVDASPLSEFTKLMELDLSNNPINYTKTDLFISLKKLINLNLTSTNLTDFSVIQQLDNDFKILLISRNPLKIDFNHLQRYLNLNELEFQQEYCYRFDNYKSIMESFLKLERVAIIYDFPNCKCIKKQMISFKLYMIDFKTDMKVCSIASSTNSNLYSISILLILSYLYKETYVDKVKILNFN